MANVEMIGEYSAAEVNSMTSEDLTAAAARGFKRPVTDPADMPAGAEVEISPGVTLKHAQPSGDVWKRKKAGADLFTCPSGQTCRLRTLTPEVLLLEGILDDVNELEGMAEQLAQKSQGAPPAKPMEGMPSKEDFKKLLNVVNVLIPLAVAEPKVLPNPPEGTAMDPNLLYASDIDLADRLAIANESLKGVRALASFRNS